MSIHNHLFLPVWSDRNSVTSLVRKYVARGNAYLALHYSYLVTGRMLARRESDSIWLQSREELWMKSSQISALADTEFRMARGSWIR